MHTNPSRTPEPQPLRLLALLATLGMPLLSACGGSSEADTRPWNGLGTAASTAPLLDDDGAVMPSDPGVMPADAGAKTRAGRYASAAQADQLERALGESAIRTQVDGSFDAATNADMAVLTVYGLQAAHSLDHTAPVLVRGADLRLAAVVANRLQDNGFTRVFLVTP